MWLMAEIGSRRVVFRRPEFIKYTAPLSQIRTGRRTMLFALEAQTLWRVDPQAETATPVGTAVWDKGPVFMAALGT